MAAGERGLGYTYGPRAVGTLVEELLADVVRGRDALDVGASWLAMGAERAWTHAGTSRSAAPASSSKSSARS